VRIPVASLARVRAARDDDGVTTFELFFDLVFVLAVTQVTAFMAHAGDGVGIVRGLLLLALLWWTWEAYTWLGNQARADEGLIRAGMIVAMAAMFVVALSIPEVWDDAPGGLDGPLVFVGAYVLARTVHLAVYTAAAFGDEGLRRQVAITFVPMLAGAALLLAGALVGGSAQTALFAAALTVDLVGTYVTSKEGNWRIHSPTHWTERHGLFVILAIGESIVAIGVGAAQRPISFSILAGAVLGVLVSVCLWWLYFDLVSLAAEHVLLDATPAERVRIAIDAYSYLHYPLVAGIVLSALGVEEVLAHAGDGEALGGFAAAALGGGLALYLAGHLGFKRRMHGTLNRWRLGAALLLVALVPVFAALPPLVALGLALAVLAGLVAVESAVYAEKRRTMRGAEPA